MKNQGRKSMGPCLEAGCEVQLLVAILLTNCKMWKANDTGREYRDSIWCSNCPRHVYLSWAKP